MFSLFTFFFFFFWWIFLACVFLSTGLFFSLCTQAMLVLCWLSLLVNERGFLRQLKEGRVAPGTSSCENLPGEGPWEQGHACRQFVPAFSSLPSFLQARLLSPLSQPHRVTAGQCYHPASLGPNWGRGHPGRQSAHASLGVRNLPLSCAALFWFE